MIRKCIRNMCEKDPEDPHPEWESIIPYMVGNVGFIFTTGDLDKIEDVVKEFVKPAAAKAGVIAPNGCKIEKGPTGLDPAQTAFFQALNIATKINKGSIEIVNDVEVIKTGQKVGSSEAALLAKLGVKPFKYGLRILYVYEGGVFPTDVLKITEETLMSKWSDGLGNVAAVSLAFNLPNDASFPHMFIKGAKNVVAVALEAGFIEFDVVKKIKDMLDNPDKYSGGGGGGGGGGGAAPAPAAAKGGAPAPAAAAKAPEPEPAEEEEAAAFDLFD
jgi:large subunit ribosomal protein LP0